MTNEQLIARAAAVTQAVSLGDNSAGSVGCALLTATGQVYTGVCIDTSSGMGYCAEHNAIGSMITGREYRIQKIVAVWKDEQNNIFILHPCGRCREFMRQIDTGNMQTEVLLGKERVARLKELLPYEGDYSRWDG